MHYALQQAAPHASVVQAFEISDIANDVYEHNHGWRPWQGNIEAVRAAMRVSFNAWQRLLRLLKQAHGAAAGIGISCEEIDSPHPIVFAVSEQQSCSAQVPRDMLEKADAQLWMLAPPCQPYTRRGLQQDANDARARSFLKLIDWLAAMQVQCEHPVAVAVTAAVLVPPQDLSCYASGPHGAAAELLSVRDIREQPSG